MVKSNFQLRIKVILDGFGFYLNLALTGLIKAYAILSTSHGLNTCFPVLIATFFFTLIVDCCDIFLCSDRPL